MTDSHVGHTAADGDHCPIMPTYGPPEVMFVRGEGSRLYDPSGKEYIDWLAGIAVTSLGHAHRGVAEAIAEQAKTLLHVSNLFATEPQWKVARIIDELVGGPAGQVFFCNSGGEANEALIKLARKHGGRGRHVVATTILMPWKKASTTRWLPYCLNQFRARAASMRLTRRTSQPCERSAPSGGSC